MYALSTTKEGTFSYTMFFDLWLMENGVEEGYVLVLDMHDASVGHVARLSLIGIKKFLYYLQEASPIRLKGFHFTNVLPFVDKILALMNPFMKKELRDMIQLHNNLEDFYKYVPKEILPSEYGGPEPDFETFKEAYCEKMILNRDILIEYGELNQINEELRPGKPKDASDLFGLEGNFKKLDID